MDLTPSAAITYNIKAVTMEGVMRVGNTNLLWTITKNIRSLECAAASYPQSIFLEMSNASSIDRFAGAAARPAPASPAYLKR